MKLCFLDAHLFEGDAVRGAALVTDDRTRPLEFRITEPVRCGALQRVLYGEILDEHVAMELIGIPLLEALREQPDYVLVCDQRLLQLQESVQFPVFWIGRDEAQDGGDDSAPHGPGGIFIGYHGDADQVREARAGLRAVAERYSLLEPFERSRTALQRMHQQAAGATA